MRPIWKPNVVYNGRYTPGLDNSSYEPEKKHVRAFSKDGKRPSRLLPL